MGCDELTVRGFLEAEGLAAAFGGRLASHGSACRAAVAREGGPRRPDRRHPPRGRVSGGRQRSARSRAPAVLTVARPVQRSERYDGVLASFQAMLLGLSALGLVAGMFIIYSTTSTAAIERSAVMAQLRLVGIDGARLFRLLMCEALAARHGRQRARSRCGLPARVAPDRHHYGVDGGHLSATVSGRAPQRPPHELAAIAALACWSACSRAYFAARRMAELHPLSAIRASDAHDHAIRCGRDASSCWWGALLATSVGGIFAEQHWKSIAWGNFGSTLWNASVIVIAIPIVRALSGWLSRFLPWAFGAEGEVAAGSLSRASARTGVTVAAIALILTIAIMLSSLVLSCRESLRSYFGGFLAADLTVSAVSTEGGWLETPLPGRVVTEIAEHSGHRARRSRTSHLQGNHSATIGSDSSHSTSSFFDPKRAPARTGIVKAIP